MICNPSGQYPRPSDGAINGTYDEGLDFFSKFSSLSNFSKKNFKIVLELQKSCRESTEIPVTLSPSFPDF